MNQRVVHVAEARDDERQRQLVLVAFLACVIVAVLIRVRSSSTLLDDFAAAGLLGTVGVALLALWPSLDPALLNRPMASLVAFVGCDGSGKSTLSADVHAELSASVRVRVCYLGLGSGAMGARIRRWPVVGPILEQRLSQKASQARKSGGKIPGLPTALVIYALSLLRLRRFKLMLRLRQRGVVVITDRYPQTQVPGIYDGPGLSAASPKSRLVQGLVGRERRLYEWMARFQPDVVIRLNIDAATALSRKPDHRADLIARKVSITPQLHFDGAPIIDIDARLPYSEVRQRVTDAIENVLNRHRAEAKGAVSHPTSMNSP